VIGGETSPGKQAGIKEFHGIQRVCGNQHDTLTCKSEMSHTPSVSSVFPDSPGFSMES